MFILNLLATSFSLDARSSLIGQWTAYPGSARSYSPQLKYTVAFHEDQYSQRAYATIWNGNQVPSAQNPNPPLSALVAEVHVFYQNQNRGLYVAGEDRRWRSFVFNDDNGRRLCNVTTKSGYSFGIFLQSEKTMELTAVAPNGTVVDQCLCFFRSTTNTTQLEEYIKKKNAAANPAEEEIYEDEEIEDEEDEEEDEENVEPQQQQQQQQQQVISSQQLSISPVAIIGIIGVIIVFELLLCTISLCRK